jgi:hypothetical protein
MRVCHAAPRGHDRIVVMAQKTVVLLEDDLDGGPAEGTVTFALDGLSYELDLSSANAAQLRDVFSPYRAAGRRVGGRSTATRRRSGAGGPAKQRVLRPHDHRDARRPAPPGRGVRGEIALLLR